MNFKHIVPRLSLIAAAVVLAACSTLPAEAPPKTDLPPAFAHGQGLEPGGLAQHRLVEPCSATPRSTDS